MFTILFSGTGAVAPDPVTVPAGQSTTLDVPLPFGTTNVSVQAQGVTIAAAPITFTEPPPPQPPTSPADAPFVPLGGVLAGGNLE